MHKFLVTRHITTKTIDGTPKTIHRMESVFVEQEDQSVAFNFIGAEEIEWFELLPEHHAALIPFSPAGQDLMISTGIGLPMHGISFAEMKELPEVIDLEQYSDYAVLPAAEAIWVKHLPACYLVRIDAPSIAAQLQGNALYDIRIKLNDRLYVIEQQPLEILAGKV